MNPPSDTIGVQLRRERERRGLSVQQVADELRLDKTVVEALENDSYDQAVPSVYARGHLRKYSRLLGIAVDEGEPPPPAGAVEPPAKDSRRHHPRPMRIAPRVRKLPWARIGIVVAILLILLLFWWSPWKHHVAFLLHPLFGNAPARV